MKAGYKHNSQLVANNSGSKALKVLENTALFEMWYQASFPHHVDSLYRAYFLGGGIALTSLTLQLSEL